MISLVMIVKNEEQQLKDCLQSIQPFVDEIIVVDTGSIDATKKIAYEFTEKVYEFSWCDDFAKARNFAVSKAVYPWILTLDADEVVIEWDREKIVEFMEKEEVLGRISIVSQYEDIHGSKTSTEQVARLFHKEYFHYEGIIHEQLIRKDNSFFKRESVPIVVNHKGYTRAVIQTMNKIERNVSLLKKAIKKTSNDPYLHYQLGKTYHMAQDYKNALSSFAKALSFSLNFEFEYIEDLVVSYGYALVNMKEFKKALELEKYHRFSFSPDFQFVMGIIYMNNAMFLKAIYSFLECVSKEKGKVEGITSYLPLYNIGVIYECLGEQEQAITYYKKCGLYEPAIKRERLLNK